MDLEHNRQTRYEQAIHEYRGRLPMVRIERKPCGQIGRLICIVAAHYRRHPQDLIRAWRGKEDIRIRHVAMYLAKELQLGSTIKIGEAFGWRDHSTVFNGWKRITAKLETDEKLAAEVAALRERIVNEL